MQLADAGPGEPLDQCLLDVGNRRAGRVVSQIVELGPGVVVAYRLPGSLVVCGVPGPAAIDNRCKAHGGRESLAKVVRRDLARHGARVQAVRGSRVGIGSQWLRRRSGEAIAGRVIVCRAASWSVRPLGWDLLSGGGQARGSASGRLRPLVCDWCLLTEISLTCAAWPLPGGSACRPHDLGSLIITAAAQSVRRTAEKF